MKKLLRLLPLLGLFVALVPALPAATDARVFELRTYTATPGGQGRMLALFRDHVVQLLAKHGMTNLGYWVPAEAKDGAGDKMVYLLAHASREAAKASWAAFHADPEWLKVRAAAEQAGRSVAKVESVFLGATDYSPVVAAGGGAGAARVFELRTYTAAEGRLAALDARFREHSAGLFTKHGMTNLWYFHPLDAEQGAADTLIYLLAHASREAATVSWAAFRADPVWTAARAASEQAAGGALTVKDGVKSVFVLPTDFSPIR